MLTPMLGNNDYLRGFWLTNKTPFLFLLINMDLYGNWLVIQAVIHVVKIYSLGDEIPK